MSRKWIVGAALVASLALPAALRAHEGHAHKVMGTVTTRHDRHVEVRTKEGKIIMIALTEKTKFARGKQQVDETALKVGDRVVVEVEGKETLTAKAVTLGGAPAAKK